MIVTILCYIAYLLGRSSQDEVVLSHKDLRKNNLVI